MRPVARLFRKTSDHLRVVTIRDVDGNVETLKTTDEHPFWVEGTGWVSARALRAGMRIGEADGSDDATVVGSVREEHPEGIAVFNFEVTGDHTYFVEDGQGEGTAIWVHNSCKRPGGYRAGDVDRHGNLSPQLNRAPGSMNSPSDGFVQSHHFIQNEWAKLNVRGYSRSAAPAVLAKSASGMPHARISAMQNIRGAKRGGTLRQEFQIAYREMLDAGIDVNTARRAARQAYKYFDSIGGFQ